VVLEELQAAQAPFRLIRLPQYERDLKNLKRLEPKLHEEVRSGIKRDIESGGFDVIKGTGGWIKGRVASPSRGIGKSGGFRIIYFLFRVRRDVYLFSVYDHRMKLDLTPDEIGQLKATAEAIKKCHANKGEDHEI
jgi:hypothetical protein